MNVIAFLDHPQLKKLSRKVRSGDYLFRQGDAGNTMFIIIEGEVRLIAERDGEEHVASVLDRGQFLGEKAIMNDVKNHQRLFSAQAKTPVTVLELRREDIESLQQNDPTAVINMLQNIFEVSARRLELSGRLIQLLRTSDNITRFVNLISYYCQASGRKVSEGIEVLLSVEGFCAHTDMSPEQVANCLTELINQKLLVKKVNDYFVVPNEQKLMNYAPTLRTNQAQASAPVAPAKKRLFGLR